VKYTETQRWRKSFPNDTDYMVMSRDQIAGRSLNMKINKRSFERVEEFKYLGTTLTNQNSVQEEIKSRLESWNASHHSGHNLLSSGLQSKNAKIKILRPITFPSFCMGVKLCRTH
jgi:hypothetical protein